MSASTQRTISNLETQFERFHSLVEGADLRADRISGWSIGQHLDHLMKADRSILGRIENPLEEAMPPLSRAGRLVLWIGWIPRGKGRAPRIAHPETTGTEQLIADIDGVRQLLAKTIEPAERLADPRRIAKHHIFGGMSAAQWLRFLEVHHRHHLKIVQDILRAEPT